MDKLGCIDNIGVDDPGVSTELPAINISNKVVQIPTTSSSQTNDFCITEDYDPSDYITDDEKIENNGVVINSYLEDFLQREDELRRLMSLNNFNQIMKNEVQSDEKGETNVLSNEDVAILSDLETKLYDIQKRYNDLLNINSAESESEENEEEDKVEEDMLEFEEARKKLRDIDKCLENINNEKLNEKPEKYLKSFPTEDTKFIEKEYLNSLNEMTKQLDSLTCDELEVFLDEGLLACDNILELN
ncbi:uncharacterized protein [Onthophagus taurus]|uniref:uncharacterized protein n=1 Tax=Onthophagus taurus TaxID=166361 RepID=UPI0039BDE6D9